MAASPATPATGSGPASRRSSSAWANIMHCMALLVWTDRICLLDTITRRFSPRSGRPMACACSLRPLNWIRFRSALCGIWAAEGGGGGGGKSRVDSGLKHSARRRGRKPPQAPRGRGRSGRAVSAQRSGGIGPSKRAWRG